MTVVHTQVKIVHCRVKFTHRVLECSLAIIIHVLVNACVELCLCAFVYLYSCLCASGMCSVLKAGHPSLLCFVCCRYSCMHADGFMDFTFLLLLFSYTYVISHVFVCLCILVSMY